MFTLTMIVLGLICLVAMLFLVSLLRCASRGTRLANVGEGQWLNGKKSFRADGAIATRNLLATYGSDVGHVIACASTDRPFGVITDEAAAAEDLVTVSSLRSSPGTMKGVTDGSGILAYSDLLVPATGGKVKKCSASSGNYYIVGEVLSNSVAATDGLPVEYDPIGAWRTI